MADYKVEVNLSNLFDEMTIREQKSFLVYKFSSLPADKMVEVVGEMLKSLNENISNTLLITCISKPRSK